MHDLIDPNELTIQKVSNSNGTSKFLVQVVPNVLSADSSIGLSSHLFLNNNGTKGLEDIENIIIKVPPDKTGAQYTLFFYIHFCTRKDEALKFLFQESPISSFFTKTMELVQQRPMGQCLSDGENSHIHQSELGCHMLFS
jgi:hypothetical protein